MGLKDNWSKEEHSWDYFSAKEYKHEWSPRHIFGQDGCDFQERINWKRMREYRYGRLQWAMKKHGFPALLLNIGDNIRYANGTWDYAWKGNNGTRYLLVFQNEPAYFFDTIGMDMEVTRMYCPWISEDRLGPAITYKFAASGFTDQCKRYWDQIKTVCKENGVDITKNKLGVDNIEIGGYEIGKSMGINLVPGAVPIFDARNVKNQDELEALKIACAWGDVGYWWAKYEYAKPGVREREVLGKVTEKLYECGAQYAWGTNVASGGNTNPYIRAFTDKIIRQGDMITLDLNSNHYYGYVQDTCRSWVVGRQMTTKQKDVYKRCYDLLQESLSVIRPGATTADIANKWPRYWDHTQKTCTLAQFAHTIGCGLYEGFWVSPGFSPDNPVELEENLYLAVETYADDGPGGDCSVRLEENLVVTKNGYQVFSLFPFEEEAVGFIDN
jgi:Xaa-Pro aminopeptidase